MAFRSHRLEEASHFICQAIERLDRPYLTLEQIELVWAVIPKIIKTQTKSIERVVHYHRSMPIETDEVFDRQTQSYVDLLEENQARFCMKLLHHLEKYLIQDKHDIDRIHLRRLQADLYLQLSHVSRPYQSEYFYKKHRKLLNDNEQLINMYKDLSLKS